jgi:hypothetical protein
MMKLFLEQNPQIISQVRMLACQYDQDFENDIKAYLMSAPMKDPPRSGLIDEEKKPMQIEAVVKGNPVPQGLDFARTTSSTAPRQATPLIEAEYHRAPVKQPINSIADEVMKLSALLWFGSNILE